MLLQIPLAEKIFARWQSVRGNRAEQSIRPFSLNWSEFLEDYQINSADDSSNAEFELKKLEHGSWVTVKHIKYRNNIIDRIIIPLAKETDWCNEFGFIPANSDEIRKIQEFEWVGKMQFVRTIRTNISFKDLIIINDFIRINRGDNEIVPIKERSLELFNDEKRLDSLLNSVLFYEGRINEVTDLRCEVIGVPLAWARGPLDSSYQPVIIIENAATWHSYCRWNNLSHQFSAVVYGEGNRFIDGIRYLSDVFKEIGGVREVFYFGDIDPQGIRIPQKASANQYGVRLPIIQPHMWSYRHLLNINNSHEQPYKSDNYNLELCNWMEDLGHQTYELFKNNKRIAQEHIGWNFLRNYSQSIL